MHPADQTLDPVIDPADFSEPEMVESAPAESDAHADTSESAEASPDLSDLPEPHNEYAPQGYAWADVLEDETLAQFGERLRVPVNVVSDANPEVVSKEGGVIRASRVAVPIDRVADV